MKRVLLLVIAISLVLAACESQDAARVGYDDNIIYQSAKLPAIGFEDYEANRKVHKENPVSDKTYDNIKAFNKIAIESMMMNYEETENLVFSPLNLYFALSLIQEGANGETKNDLQELMNTYDVDTKTYNEEISHLYRLLYTDNAIGKLHLANSLWLDHEYAFKETFVDNIEGYYSDLFSVDFSSSDLTDKVNQWIEDRTNGLLHFTSPLSDDEILKVISTLYFYDEWIDRFDEANTKKDTFIKSDGSQVDVDFMNQTYGVHGFRRNEYFQSSYLGMKNKFTMNFYLPNEGVSVEDMLSDQAILLLIMKSDYDDHHAGEVVFKIPKFSIDSELSLKESLDKMGIGRMFTRNADFSEMVDTNILYVSNVIQNSHLAIDEKGVEAASYTQIDYAGSPMPDGRCEMILDRPFVFTITGYHGICLYVGVVNDPSGD